MNESGTPVKSEPSPVKAKVQVYDRLHDCEILGTIDKNWTAIRLYGVDLRVRPEQIYQQGKQ
jgi:hypothetical protein